MADTVEEFENEFQHFMEESQISGEGLFLFSQEVGEIILNFLN